MNEVQANGDIDALNARYNTRMERNIHIVSE
jgi:hypothetical protein